MASTPVSLRPEPFVKWAGGKRLLLGSILPQIPKPDRNGRYIEPFLGGGAVFFALQPERALLNDANEELVEAFRTVRDQVDDVMEVLRDLKFSEREYYRIRTWRPTCAVERTARFIYLNKTCFNGLYRVNLLGEFNVPVGRHKRSVVICDEYQLRSASAALRGVELRAGDFGFALRSAHEGDVVYCDPPYTTAHRDNGFVEYNARVFSLRGQRRLASWAHVLINRGVSVVISNADHESVTALYDLKKFDRFPIDRWSTIAGKASHRFPTSEVLLVSRPR